MDHASYLVCLHSLLIFDSSVVCHDSNILKAQAPSYMLSWSSNFSLGPCVSPCQSTFILCAWEKLAVFYRNCLAHLFLCGSLQCSGMLGFP